MHDKEKLFDAIFTTHYRGLVYYAAKFVNNDTIAEDLVQDVFVKVWDRVPKLRNLVEIKAYLYKCVRNRCLDELRATSKIANQTLLETTVKLPPLAEQLSYLLDAESIALIYNAVERLPEGSKRVVMLSLSGLKNPEIAQIMHISVNTVRAQKQRAIAALRETLKPELFLSIAVLLLN